MFLRFLFSLFLCWPIVVCLCVSRSRSFTLSYSFFICFWNPLWTFGLYDSESGAHFYLFRSNSPRLRSMPYERKYTHATGRNNDNKITRNLRYNYYVNCAWKEICRRFTTKYQCKQYDSVRYIYYSVSSIGDNCKQTSKHNMYSVTIFLSVVNGLAWFFKSNSIFIGWSTLSEGTNPIS